MNIPKLKRASGTDAGSINPATWNSLIEYVEALEIRLRAYQPHSSADVKIKSDHNGFTMWTAKKATSPARQCPFGELIPTPESDPPTKSIRGGIINCGDQTWNMDPDEIDSETVGAWLVSIAIECIANTDDDHEILLPGIETGTKPEGAWERTAWTEGTDYPENTNPAAVDGTGTIYVPIGKLTVTAGVGDAPNKVSFEPAACGHITIGHCAGTLSYTRA